MIDGNHSNDTYQLAYIAIGQGLNLNILNRDTVMKNVDSIKLEISMVEELDKMWNNKIYEIIKKVEVLDGYKIMRSVWIRRRNTTPGGNIYHHRSLLCADVSTHIYGIDNNETYSPVVMW